MEIEKSRLKQNTK